METNPQQVKGLVVTSRSPRFYEICFDPADLKNDRILFLNGNTWLCTVIGFRSTDLRIQNLPAVRQIW